MNSVTCRRQQVLILTSCFMVLCLTGYFVPYVHDDWAWGGSLGLERLANFFQDYNGRYLGNLLVIAGTHSRLFKALSICCCLPSCFSVCRGSSCGSPLPGFQR